MAKSSSHQPVPEALFSHLATFLPSPPLPDELSPRHFRSYITSLEAITDTVQQDLRKLLFSRGWAARGRNPGSRTLLVKVFPDGHVFRLPQAEALRVEQSYCTAVTCARR